MEVAAFIFLASCLVGVILLANKLASDEPVTEEDRFV